MSNAGRSIEARAPAPHTILMTKFINHSVQERYRKAQNLRLCNGGVSELSVILKSIS
jgi:hypothetical protein